MYWVWTCWWLLEKLLGDFPKELCPCTVYETRGSTELCPPLHLLLFVLITVVLVGVKWRLTVFWVCISPMASDIDYLFICLLAVCAAPREKFLLRYVAYFFATPTAYGSFWPRIKSELQLWPIQLQQCWNLNPWYQARDQTCCTTEGSPAPFYIGFFFFFFLIYNVLYIYTYKFLIRLWFAKIFFYSVFF